MPYRVIDNPAKLTNADWDRVVAVFVMGQVSTVVLGTGCIGDSSDNIWDFVIPFTENQNLQL